MRKSLSFISLCLALCLSLCSCMGESAVTSVTSYDTSTVSTTVGHTVQTGSANIVAGGTQATAEFANTSEMDFEFSKKDTDGSYSGGTKIVFADGGSSVSGTGASANGADVTVTKAGTYIISGTADARLTVECGKEDKVQLVLNGVTLESSSGPAIYIKSADKVFITLASGSVNTLSDASSYDIVDGDTTLDAALFSREDLTLNGEGTLNVNGNFKHGIVSKDDLVIAGGVINVTSQNVGLNGKDCVKVTDAVITVDAGSDGIRSDNEEDENRGYIYIGGGTLNITAGNDGMQAQTVLKVDNGNITLKTGGGSANASTKQDGGFNFGWGSWGGGYGSSSGSTSSSSESAKGLKAVSDILISGGVINIDSSDDALHSNGSVNIEGGNITVSSGDDGIHADTSLVIANGNINITKSYEGLEATDLVVAGGNISIVASDDGLNAAGGNDSSSVSGRPGQGMFSGSSGTLTISGGYMYVNATGDGLDSNGPLTVTGGVTLVSGPTSSGNGPLDCDGSATITGGVVVATGSSGMAVGFSSAENQGAILYSFSTRSGGTSIAVCDENGNVIVSFTPEKSYQSIAVSAPGIQSGSSYKIVVGADVANTDENGYALNSSYSGGSSIATIKMTSNVYGSSGGMGGFPGGNGSMFPGGR